MKIHPSNIHLTIYQNSIDLEFGKNDKTKQWLRANWDFLKDKLFAPVPNEVEYMSVENWEEWANQTISENNEEEGNNGTQLIEMLFLECDGAIFGMPMGKTQGFDEGNATSKSKKSDVRYNWEKVCSHQFEQKFFF